VISRPELHADDLRAREWISAELRRIRTGQGRPCRSVAADLGLKKNAYAHMEKVTTWTVPKVQAWARVLDHRFVMTIHGLATPDDQDPTAAILAATTTFGGLDEDQLHLYTVVNDLIRVRKWFGMWQREVGRRLGVTENAVRGWEKDHSATHVRSVQRYARALGGSLELDVVPVHVPAGLAS
jgi:DNA-binding XRE family transcriptional regulator